MNIESLRSILETAITEVSEEKRAEAKMDRKCGRKAKPTVRYALVEVPQDWKSLSTGPYPEITEEDVALYILAGRKPETHPFGCSRCSPFEDYRYCAHDAKGSKTYEIVMIERD